MDADTPEFRSAPSVNNVSTWISRPPHSAMERLARRRSGLWGSFGQVVDMCLICYIIHVYIYIFLLISLLSLSFCVCLLAFFFFSWFSFYFYFYVAMSWTSKKKKKKTARATSAMYGLHEFFPYRLALSLVCFFRYIIWLGHWSLSFFSCCLSVQTIPTINSLSLFQSQRCVWAAV